MTRLAPLMLMALLPAAAAAQDMSTSTAVLTHFATRCGQIAADPTKAVSGIAGASARIAGDRSLITHNEPAGPNGEIRYRQMSFADGKSSDCALTVTGYQAAQYDDMGALIAQNGAALFGTEVTLYGNATPGNAVQMIATPGYPPAAALTLVQTRDQLEMVLSLHSGVTAPVAPEQPAAAPQPATVQPEPPQPQVLEIAPEQPEGPAEPTNDQLAMMETIDLGLTACLIVADAPSTWAPSLGEVGFLFQTITGAGDIVMAKDGVTARLSATPSAGFCTLIAEDLPLEFGTQAGMDTAAKTAAGTATPTTSNGCEAVAMTAPAAPVTMIFLNPGYQAACDSPMGSAVSLVLQ